MTSITIQEAQATLSDLIRGLAAGDEVLITEDDRPVAKLIPTAPERARRVPQFGTLAGTVLSMEHFDDPLDEFEEYQ